MSNQWTPLHEWIAQFLMDDATYKLAPCEMAYRIVDAVSACAPTPDQNPEGEKPQALSAKHESGLPEGSST